MCRNYVAAWQDWRIDKVVVLERDAEGALFKKLFNPPYYFYVPDKEGPYISLFGDKLSKLEFDNRDDYDSAKQHFPKKFESDINPLKRILMDEYYGKAIPRVNFAFLDIEVNYKQELGFSSSTNPYAEINAVTIYQSWTKKYLTYAIAPPNYTGGTKELVDKFNELISKDLLRKGIIPEIKICKDEPELILLLIASIQDADIISGWNSEFFDIPYICERILLLGGEQMLSRLEYAGVKAPRKEMVNKFGSEEPTYKFTGRTHLDYMKLFMKFTFEGRTSYSLGNILEEEVGIGKLEYNGTLEQLYNNDFPTFVAYNFRDVDGLVQLDDKLKFIALSNQIAHENTVLFPAVLGTVAYVETGIANHAHRKLNRIIMDKNISDTERVEGAVVLTPRIGVHEYIGSVDINSLYPNEIRSLNISPEKIIGQFYSKEKAWSDIYEQNQCVHTFLYETGIEETRTATEWREHLISKVWAVSGYGTVFDQSCGNGVIPDMLQYWYTERKRLQAEKKKWGKLADSLPDGKEKDDALFNEAQFDLLQLTKKIAMNSLYGALLNAAFTFGDERMGASVTASGRQITTYMLKTVGKLLTDKDVDVIKTTTIDKKSGKVDNEYTTDCDAIIYSDTDSCYFKTYATLKEEAIEIADLVAEQLNDSFPSFMHEGFLCTGDFTKLIQAGREIVASRGIFLAKKKYICKVIDKEGKSVNELKAQGSEIKKSDTPKIIQNFLKGVVNLILDGEDYDTIASYVNQERKNILKNKNNVFALGVAKQVNNMDKFIAEYNNPGTIRSDNGRTLTVPGGVRAAFNYNKLVDIFEKGAKKIRSGDKVLVYSLKPNSFDFKTLAFPSDIPKFPQWFLENFSVDIKTTEEKMFDSKLSGMFNALGKDIPTPQSVLSNSILDF